MNMVALIPARAGSKRVSGKNIRPLAGHPLVAYTIAAAKESGVFSAVFVSTEDEAIGRLASAYGATWIVRLPQSASDEAPDMLWVSEALYARDFNAFAILRPTSPFRRAETILRAFTQFKRQEVHSIRAVQPAKEHPGKQWFIENGCLQPILNKKRADGTPWHSSPTQTLPSVWAQNASLEMAWTYVVKSFGTISGTKIAPFYTQGYEGLNIDTEDDWTMAYLLAEKHPELLPKVTA